MIEFLERHSWTATALIALAAVFAAMALHRAGRAFLLRVTHGSVLMRSILAATDSAAAATLPIIALEAVWQLAPDTLRWIGLVRHVNGLLLIAAVTWYIVSLLGGLAQGMVESHPAHGADNLNARRIQTQTRVLTRSATVLVLIGGFATALMTFPGARQLGASLLASAGVLGVIGGVAARPVFSNLIAGLQLALAQPLRIDDVLIVEGEWGRVEEITGSYVVLKIWDERRLIVPLQWFIEHPFQNWTRTGAELHQAVYLFVDYATPLEPLRAELRRIVEAAPEWDRRTATLVAVDSSERALKLRALVSAGSSGAGFDLGCKVREGLTAYLSREYPGCLPVLRTAPPGGLPVPAQ